MAKVSVNFRTVRKFQAELDRFARETTRERKLREVLQPVADLLLQEAKDRVAYRTGELQRSLVVVPEVSGKAGKARAGLTLGHTGPRVRLSHLIEFGTKFAAARPYLRPALAVVGRKAPAMMVAGFRRVLKIAANNTKGLRLK